MTQWILALMLALVPTSPWRATYADTAQAIADAAEADAASRDPLYGPDGATRTAAELVAIARYESSFDPRATQQDRGGLSLGLLQVNESNLRTLGLAKREDLFDVRTNLRAALVLLHASHRTCRGRPALDRDAQYASGGPRCDVPAGVAASRARLGLAAELLAEHPPFWTEPIALTSY